VSSTNGGNEQELKETFDKYLSYLPIGKGHEKNSIQI
jgi:hypothetical protein